MNDAAVDRAALLIIDMQVGQVHDMAAAWRCSGDLGVLAPMRTCLGRWLGISVESMDEGDGRVRRVA